MALTRLIALEDCPPDRGTFVPAGGNELAVFRLSDDNGEARVVVIDNACPHSSGNLAAGEVTEGHVTCPVHLWEFDLKSGECTHSPRARVRRYRTEIRDGDIWVDLPDIARPPD